MGLAFGNYSPCVLWEQDGAPNRLASVLGWQYIMEEIISEKGYFGPLYFHLITFPNKKLISLHYDLVMKKKFSKVSKTTFSPHNSLSNYLILTFKNAESRLPKLCDQFYWSCSGVMIPHVNFCQEVTEGICVCTVVYAQGCPVHPPLTNPFLSFFGLRSPDCLFLMAGSVRMSCPRDYKLWTLGSAGQ